MFFKKKDISKDRSQIHPKLLMVPLYYQYYFFLRKKKELAPNVKSFRIRNAGLGSRPIVSIELKNHAAIGAHLLISIYE